MSDVHLQEEKMKAFTEPLKELGEFLELKNVLQKRSVQIAGCIDAQKAHFIYAAGEDYKKKLIVTYSELRAKELYENYRLFDKNVMLYPAKDLIFYSADVQSNLLAKYVRGEIAEYPCYLVK